jgi:hypothetical protein
MRNKLLLFVVTALWLVFTPLLCIYCWESGRIHGPLILDRPAKDVASTPAPVSLSDDLTNTPLNSYSFGLTIVPKVEGVPASGYVVLLAVPNNKALPAGSLPDGMLEMRGVFQNGYEIVKPFTISAEMLRAPGPFIIFLDYTTSHTDLFEFHMPQIRREK